MQLYSHCIKTTTDAMYTVDFLMCLYFGGEILLKVMYFLGFSLTCVCSLGLKLQISPAGFKRLKIIFFLSSELYSANITHEGAVHPGYSVKLKLGICKAHLQDSSHQDTHGERQVSAHEHYRILCLPSTQRLSETFWPFLRVGWGIKPFSVALSLDLHKEKNLYRCKIHPLKTPTDMT